MGSNVNIPNEKFIGKHNHRNLRSNRLKIIAEQLKLKNIYL